MRPVQNVSCDNEFHLNDNKNNFHINDFALSLTLKQRFMATWKWPTPQLMGTFLGNWDKFFGNYDKKRN